MNKEKVRELVVLLRRVPSIDFEYNINKWLEQNQPEPVVVGLSDKQMADFGAFVYGFDKSAEKLENMLRDWHSRQTFTQPEAKEVTVGLSDEQIASLIAFLRKEGILSSALNHASYIKEWQDTQGFRNRQITNFEFAYNSLLEDNAEMTKKLEQLKSQQFESIWDSAPRRATSVKLSYTYFDHKGSIIMAGLLREEQRPKPTPQVEMGQVWRLISTDIEFKVIGTNDDVITLKVRYWSDSSMKTSMSDFLDKFERVS